MLGRAVLAVLVGLLVTAAPAAAASQKVRSYRVSEVRDLLDRTAVTVAGAAIVEVDHAEVVSPPTGAPCAGCGARASRSSAWRRAQASARGARAAAFPPADSAYHDYAEMAAECRRRRPRTRRIVAALQHRQLVPRAGRSGP